MSHLAARGRRPFLTVTLNPALDKTLTVHSHRPNATLRATDSLDLPGGKGVNAARALMRLGASARVLMPLGGRPGEQVADLARAEGMELARVPITAQTRTVLTVRVRDSGEYLHYLEPGPPFSDDEIERIRLAFEEAVTGCETVLLSGSVPEGAVSLIPWMLERAAAHRVHACLDSFTPGVDEPLRSGAWLVKPNLQELEFALRRSLPTEEARWQALEGVASSGTALAVLTMAGEGAIALAEGRRYRLVPPSVELVNDLGSGDSMAAGICWAAANGWAARECLVWGVACGAANAAVWDPGGIDLDQVRRLAREVRVLEE